jgi:photosystem II stability/assembly factor-like uncharacterized protein
MGGLLFRGSSDLRQWAPVLAGLPPGCPYVTALAVSPAYAQDKTLLAGIMGSGLFRSGDGGRSWQPASAGLPSMGIQQLLISPNFAADRLAFAHVASGPLQRSADGGLSWQGLTITPTVAALSPDFGQDHVLAAVASAPGSWERGIPHLSRNGGVDWQPLAWTGDEAPMALSIAPSFSRWGVLFAHTFAGTLYRSTDAGASWQSVLRSGQMRPERATWLYGADEAQRPIYFLTVANALGTEARPDGRLFRSRDGGEHWEQVALPGGAIPTALAASSEFGQDGLLVVGTADGHVLRLPGSELPPAK